MLNDSLGQKKYHKTQKTKQNCKVRSNRRDKKHTEGAKAREKSTQRKGDLKIERKKKRDLVPA